MSQIYFDDVIVSCINNADQQRGHVLAFVASRTRYKLQMIQEPPVATSPRCDVVGIVNVASGRVTWRRRAASAFTVRFFIRWLVPGERIATVS
jgi:hypothetical protein